MKKYKYPKTPHFLFSEGRTSDDKTLKTDHHFYHFDEVVISYKMDGENTTIYSDGSCHARSINSTHKDYHSWLLSFIPKFSYLIPEGYRICGEYLYAKHSIKYENLSSYFEVFSIWNGDTCLSWNDTEILCKKLNLYHVPVVYIGPYDTYSIIKIAQKSVKNGQEGIVVRNAGTFEYNNFDINIAKYVRKNHIQTDKHWLQNKIEKNICLSQ